MKSPSFSDEPDLAQRIADQTDNFAQLYNRPAATIVRAPGRAEILGNHTDYNNGFALAAGISKSTLALLAKRDDQTIRIRSQAFPNHEVSFAVGETQRNEQHTWVNYAIAVVNELIKHSKDIGGADMLIDSTVPKSGGVSSSAAYELAVARGLLALYGQTYDPIEVALICKKAENSDMVKSPCGFLDQGAVALAKHAQLVLFDFLPKGDLPVSDVEHIPTDFSAFQCAFVIVVDPSIERQLGESGYVERRKMCEDSLPFWQSVLRRDIASLRDVSVEEFEWHKQALESKNPVMRMRVEHVVYENFRVLEAVKALKTKDIAKFGQLLTDSGKSALDLYELDENTPQLSLLVETGRTLDGVLGMRNMGGGFSAIALALVQQDKMPDFQQKLNAAYSEQFQHDLQFIAFSVTEGAEVLL